MVEVFSTPGGRNDESFSEIKSISHFSERGTSVVNTESGKQTECKGYFADSSPFVFDFKRVSGDSKRALTEPSSVVLTRSLSEKLFGKKDPIGEKLTFGDDEELWVKAVIEDLPQNSYLRFDYLVSMPTFYTYLKQQGLDVRFDLCSVQ